MRVFLLRLAREDEGQDLIEYALLAAFIALTSVAMITDIGTGLNLVYTSVSTEIQSIGGS